MKSIGIQIQDGDIDTATELNISVIRDSKGLISQGMVIGDITNQNIALLLTSHPGEFKESPSKGIGMDEALQDTELLAYRHAIRKQLTDEGMIVKKLDLYNINTLAIEARYK